MHYRFRSLSILPAVLLILVLFIFLIVSHHVHCDRDGKDENIVLPILDLHSIGVGQAEPLLRNFSNLGPSLLHRILMVKDISLHIEIGSVMDLHIPLIPEGSDERLLDRGNVLAVRILDHHRILDGQ